MERIVKKPKVYLLARPQLVTDGLEAFLADNNLRWPTPRDDTQDAEVIVEAAGRCCYMSFGSRAASPTNYRYIQNLLGRNSDGSFKPGPAHGSVVEHPVWSFIIVGAGRGFSHEVVRHRVGTAFSQLSTRYCNFEADSDAEGDWVPGFAILPLAQLSDDAVDAISQSLTRAREDYKQLLAIIETDLTGNAEFMQELEKLSPRERKRTLRKAARGAAREVLPIATEAIMVLSMNARAIWNVIALRANEHAEAVIREVFVQMARIMEQEMPALFNGLEYKTLWDGSEAVVLPRDKL